MDVEIKYNGFDVRKWEATKKDWRNRIEKVKIRLDQHGQTIEIEEKLDELFTEASYYFALYKTQYINLNDYMDAIRELNLDKGSNPEERRANASAKIAYYPDGDPEDKEAINLYEIRNKLRDRYFFFRDYVINNLETKHHRLNTNVGAGKVEARMTPRTQ